MAHTNRVEDDLGVEAAEEGKSSKSAESHPATKARKLKVKYFIEQGPDNLVFKIDVNNLPVYRINVRDGPGIPDFEKFIEEVKKHFDLNLDKQIAAAFDQLISEAVFAASRKFFGYLLPSQAEVIERGRRARLRLGNSPLIETRRRGRPRSWSQFDLDRALREAAASLRRVTWPALAEAVNRANPGRSETDQTLRRHAAELLGWKIKDVRAAKSVGKTRD